MKIACLRIVLRHVPVLQLHVHVAEQIGLSVDALRKIEAGVNGAKIDTLISIAELFHISLDYLVCGCERKAEVDDLLVGLKEKEVQFMCLKTNGL